MIDSYSSKSVISLLAIALLLLSGCATRNKGMYYWGEYEQLILDSYIAPGKADTSTQIQKLNTVIQQSENNGKKVAPGIYAHLGFLYASKGQINESKSAFVEEKTLYPEASTFIDGMLQRAKVNGAN